MQPLFTAQSPPNAGLFQFPLAGNYTQVGGMPMEICSLRPDSKMCCSHLGRRARERRWQVSPPSLSPDPCLGVWWSLPSAPPSRGGGADSWTQKSNPANRELWAALKAEHWVIWACSQMCCWDSKAFKSCFKPVWSPVCSEHWKIKAQTYFLFPLTITFLAVMHEFLLNHV